MTVGTFWDACLLSSVVTFSPFNQALLHESFDLLFMSGIGQSLIFCSFHVRSQTGVH